MNLSGLFSARAALVGALVVAVAGAPAFGQTTVHTAPAGVMSASAAKGTRGLAFPLIGENLYVGIISSTTADRFALTSASGDVKLALADAGRCYVEVATGPFEGERLAVNVAATLAEAGNGIVLQLGEGSLSTLATLPTSGLDGARVWIRPHVTLARLQTMFTPALVGRNNAMQADGVQLFDGTNWIHYHLRADGATWVQAGQSADVRELVIPPDASAILDLKSGTKAWLHEGAVRTNAFRKNLIVGLQSFASGFPQALSPVDVGGFVEQPPQVGTGWTGGAEHEVADWFERHAVAQGMPFNRYFLQANGQSWKRVNDNSTDYAHHTILGATDALVLRRFNPDPAYLIPVPFSL